METVMPGWAYTLHLPHNPRAPRIARTTLRAVLDGHAMKDLADTAGLLACELVTNAYRHTDGPSLMRLRAVRDGLRISVWDTHPTIPSPFDKPPWSPGPASVCADPEAENGRGLQIVRNCTTAWGGYRLEGGLFGAHGKLLWIELARPGGMAPATYPHRPSDEG